MNLGSSLVNFRPFQQVHIPIIWKRISCHAVCPPQEGVIPYFAMGLIKEDFE